MTGGTLFALVAGCGSAAPQAVGGTTLDARLQGREETSRTWSAALGAQAELAPEGLRLRWDLPAADWTRANPDAWSLRLPVLGRFAGTPGFDARLESDGGTWTWRGGSLPEDLAPHEFNFQAGALIVRNRPSGRARLTCTVPRGHRDPESWRIATGRVCGRGIPAWPGERWTVSTSLPPASALRFATSALPTRDDPAAELVFRVELDGVPLWSASLPTRSADGWFTVPLPRGGARAVELAFCVEGPPALSAFLAPRIGPAAPPARERPDVILFLADTLRADSLAVYGGSPEWTPHLNALAEECLVFRSARGTSSWTLPSQGSMFTGLWPPEHGAQLEKERLPEDVETLAESFAAAGYRTGAVTDGGFVSERYGFGQGFEWYVEHQGYRQWNLHRTLELADQFLRARDERPTLLFIHTYRTHAPYRTGPEESPRASLEFLRSFVTDSRKGNPPDPSHAMHLLRELYLDGVHDLDAKFGAWWDELRAGGWNGILVFTSDHGEAFGEHGNRGHRGRQYDELLRVPLLIRAPGLAPRISSNPASLVDLPRTLAARVGVRPPASWGGLDLAATQVDRPVFAFYRSRSLDEVAIVYQEKKWLAPPHPEALVRGECTAAFDLRADPQEQDNVLGRAEWPTRLGADVASALANLLASARPGRQLRDEELGAEVLRDLKEIGYF